jgi:hypothetical protein
LRTVIGVCAWVLLAGGFVVAVLTLIRLVFGWPRPVTAKPGAWVDSWDYVWLGGFSFLVGLFVLGYAVRNHGLSDAGLWSLMAYNCLSLGLRVRGRLKARGRRWWRTWES